MTEIKICTKEDIETIAHMRADQQIEDWGEEYRQYAERFYGETKVHLEKHLGESLFFFMLFSDGEPAAMCALEETGELPQINICVGEISRHGYLVSVYTKPEYRGRGYQQMLIKELLDFAREKRFATLSLTTNEEISKHIYRKAGFSYLSDKFNIVL